MPRIIALGCVFVLSTFTLKATAEDVFQSLTLELSLISSQIEDLRESLLSPEVRSLAPADAGIALLRLDALEAQLRSMVGRVEALEFHLEILSRDAIHRISEFNRRLAELKEQDVIPELDPEVITNETKPITDEPGQFSNETLDFDRAVLSFNSKDFQSALTRFESFNELYPQSMNAAESFYWLGKTNEELINFKSAASSYLESFSRDPNGFFAWKSLLGLAVSLGKLGQLEQGCLTLKELKSRFPDTVIQNRDDVLIAEEQLKCSP